MTTNRFSGILLLCAFIMTSILHGQSEESTISLEDSLAYQALKGKFASLINPNPDSAYAVIQQMDQLIDSIDYFRGKVDVEYLFASYYRRIQNSDSSIFHFERALAKAEQYNYDAGKAIAYNGLCHVYSKLGEMKKAISTCEACIEIAGKIGKPNVEAASYLAMGQIHMRQNELSKALTLNLKIDSIHQNDSIRNDIIAGAYQNIGSIYMGLDEYDKSEKYFLQSIAFYEAMPQNVTFYIKHANLFLGQLNYKKEKFEEAKLILEDCHTYFASIKDNHSLAEISKTLGLCYINLNQEAKGSEYLQQAYDLQSEFGNRNENAIIGLDLGKVYIDQGKYNRAIDILKKALSDVPELNNSAITQEAHLKLSEAYGKMGNYEKAYHHNTLGSNIKDSLQLIQNAGQIRELESRYQNEQKEREINELKSQKELIDQQNANQRNIFIATIGLTSLASLFFFFLYRNRQKTNKKLKEIDEAKSTFFTNISHEFRTPLTLIKGPIQEQLNKTDLDQESREKFEMMDRNSDRLLNLVDQTLSISKIESGNLLLTVDKGDLLSFIGTLADAFGFMAQDKGIEYVKRIEETKIEAWFDADAMEKIFTNLMGNAMKYTPMKGEIYCNARIEEGKLKMSIKNTGEGIRKEDLSKVFDRFFQVKEEADGVGVGLSLVRDLVHLHKGNIKVDSNNEYTSFDVEIPVIKSNYTEVELSVSNMISNPNVTASEEIEGYSDKPILLIVEDNKDVRSFVKSIFKYDYKILEAINGEEGIETALEHVPDIILSDVMMPVKDGIELSQTLKTNECTSHIPIILLTAKVGDDHELEGVKSGADDYITKPFNIELLKTKINNLMESRRKLIKKYSNEFFVKPKEIATTSADEKLFGRIRTIMDDKISDGKFSVEEFSKLIGMSRMQLHRKLKAITGLSASEFLRSQRIKMAAHLLKETDKNVSEVGFSVGFNDHAYFSKCFKEVYKCTPSEYSTK